jgi:hypothetical protein
VYVIECAAIDVSVFLFCAITNALVVSTADIVMFCVVQLDAALPVPR